jgi:hypothetical protein
VITLIVTVLAIATLFHTAIEFKSLHRTI